MSLTKGPSFVAYCTIFISEAPDHFAFFSATADPFPTIRRAFDSPWQPLSNDIRLVQFGLAVADLLQLFHSAILLPTPSPYSIFLENHSVVSYRPTCVRISWSIPFKRYRDRPVSPTTSSPSDVFLLPSLDPSSFHGCWLTAALLVYNDSLAVSSPHGLCSPLTRASTRRHQVGE